MASPPVLIPESLQSGSACPFGGLREQPLSRRRWMVSAVPVPERLWEVAPSAGPAALSPADERSIEAGRSAVEKPDDVVTLHRWACFKNQDNGGGLSTTP